MRKLSHDTFSVPLPAVNNDGLQVVERSGSHNPADSDLVFRVKSRVRRGLLSLLIRADIVDFKGSRFALRVEIGDRTCWLAPTFDALGNSTYRTGLAVSAESLKNDYVTVRVDANGPFDFSVMCGLVGSDYLAPRDVL